MKKLIIILAALCAFSMTGCTPRRHVPHKKVAAHHLSDGRYVYRDDTGLFWYYMIYTNNLPTYYSSPSLASSTLPRGGAWVSEPAQEPDIEQQIASTPSVVESIPIDASGSPMTITEIEAEGRDGVDVDEAGDNSSDSSDSSDSSSDGGGDSGGGDSGGGSGGE